MTTTGKWSRYPAYIDSGVEWLGQLPDSWRLLRLKNVASINTDTLNEDHNPAADIEYIDISNVGSDGIVRGLQAMPFAQAPSRARRLVKPGDTILSTVRTYLKAIAFMEAPSPNTVVSTGFAVLRPQTGVDPRFLNKLVQCAEFIDAVTVYSDGIGYPAIAQSRLSALPIWTPPLSEQRAIVAFLDREAAKIDALIAKKGRLISLLDERRRSVISRAVTCGLAPFGPLKPSGLDWLGSIPAQWQVKPLKRVAAIRYGLGQPPRVMEDGLPLIRATNVERGKINPTDLIYVDPDDVPYGRDPVLRTGDIVVVRSGAYTGDSAIIPPEWDGAISGYDMVVRVRTIVARFLAYCLLSPYMLNSQIDLCRLRAAQPHLNAEELGLCWFIEPPMSEQHQIVEHLDRETQHIDRVIAKSRHHIEKLREYRTALISAAVTGKIDVREAT